jgi:hypothetical protein
MQLNTIQLGEACLLAKLKTRNLLVYSIVLLLIVSISSELVAVANSATAPLSPVIEITPRRVSIDENITLSIKITVNEPSNVTASRPVINGDGDASLYFENSSIILEPDQIGVLEWRYGAIKSGTIDFVLTLTVKELSDEKVVLTQSLNSSEIGISRLSDFFLIGLMILVLYVLLSSRFNWAKPKESYFKVFGGWITIAFIIAFWFVGYVFAYLSFNIGDKSEMANEISVIIWGLVLVVYGIECCLIHRKFTNSMFAGSLKERFQNVEITEISGLSIIVSGLSGFFSAWNLWSGIALLILVGILAIGKEFIEMDIKWQT